MADKQQISLTQCTTPMVRVESESLENTENSWLNLARRVHGLYIHIPFCFHKCHYCDFFSIANADNEHERFTHALVQELQTVAPHIGEIETIFIGGGTPTLLEDSLLLNVLETVKNTIATTQTVEWTVEANPETVTASNAAMLVESGVNRISLGAQTFHPILLKELERWHDPENVHKSVAMLREAGIENINLDLIYAIPSQTMGMLKADLDQLLAINPEHLSCYALAYEPNTPLEVKLRKGAVNRIEHDLEAEMFSFVSKTLKSNGYDQYEISNFSKAGYECKHNVMYWENKSWWACGPSAAGHIEGLRWRNVPRLRDYFKQTPLPPVIDVEQLSLDRQMGEVCMLGLRLSRGIPRKRVEDVIQQSTNHWRGEVIDKHIKGDLLEWQNNALALTEKGRLVADMVIGDLLMQDT